MDAEMLKLIIKFQKEQIANRTAETNDNKAYLAMVSHALEKLK